MRAKRAVKRLATAEKILSNLIRECLASARALRRLDPAKTSAVRPSVNPTRTESATPSLTDLSVGFRLLEKQERRLLVSALKRVGGNQTKAARILRISRDRMRYKMSKHNLK
jgi:DNA-binding NtrC family response regulator